MARDCSICTNRAHHEIDAALIQGRSCRAVAAAHDLDFRAVDRHRRNHLPTAIRAAAAEALARVDIGQTAPNITTPAPPAREAVAAAIAVTPASAPAASPPVSAVRARQRTRGIQLEETPPAPPVEQSATTPTSTAPATAIFNLYQSATDLRERAMAILTAAERDRDAKTALMAIREARGVLDHMSRLEERQGGTAAAVPLDQSPEWHRTRAAIVAALEAFPEARLAVAEALVSTGAMT